MPTVTPTIPPELHWAASRMLHELGIPIHRIGYKQLCIAIVRFAGNDSQSLTKELYPFIAAQYGYADWHPVEHSIRLVILHAWENRDPGVWYRYFPGLCRQPSNKQFIATIAEFL